MSFDPQRKTYKYPLGYNGNVLWPILFIFLFPPLGMFLILLNANFRKGGVTYFLHYKGSEFWLLVWTIAFFPVAIALGIFNGFDVVELSDEA
jgi:hypothetical protein